MRSAAAGALRQGSPSQDDLLYSVSLNETKYELNKMACLQKEIQNQKLRQPH